MCTPMFTAALLTITRRWKKLKCPLTDEQIKKTGVYIYNIIIPSLSKEENPVICYVVNKP